MSHDDDIAPSSGGVREPELQRTGCGFRYAEDELSAGVDFSGAAELLNTNATVLDIREATPEDAPVIAELVNSAYRGESSRAGWTTEADVLGGQRTDAEMIREFMASSVFRLAFEDETLAGTMQIEALDKERAELGMLAVKPTRQTEGIGRRLVTEAERFARESLGRSILRMRVLDHREELISYYERRGFHRTEGEAPFPQSPRFGEPKVANLRFAILEKSLT